MAITFRTVLAALFSIMSLIPAAGQSPSSARELHSQVTLLSGGKQGEHWLAGIEITLDQGFKTYWRNPGESGLPPRFDWSGSENLASAEILWPAPARHEDAGGIAYVYSRKVVLPVRVKAASPDKPVKLALSADYGICKDICIPAHAELGAALSEAGPDRAAIEEALAKVPRPQALGEQAELSVLSAEPSGSEKSTLTVTVQAPTGTKPVLFAEGPENWYLSTSTADDRNRFTVIVEEKPKDATGPVPLRLTLVTGSQAIETEVRLDVGPQAR